MNSDRLVPAAGQVNHVVMSAMPSFVLSLGMLGATLAPLHADPYGDAVMRDRPLAYYRLDEAEKGLAPKLGARRPTEGANRGNSPKPGAVLPIVDQMKSNNGIFVNGPAIGVAGAIATNPESMAVSFSRAASQHVQLTTFGTFGKSMSSGFTVEYWLKTADAKQYQAIMGSVNSSGYVTDFVVDSAYTGVAGRLRLYYRDDKSNRYEVNFLPEEKNINIYDDAWHHIAHVYDPKAVAVNDRVVLYVDGIRQTVNVFQGGKIPASSNFKHPLTLGAMNLRGKIQEFLQGSLDEVAFYKTSLSENQLRSHFQAARSSN